MNNSGLIDTHAHITYSKKQDTEKIIQNALDNGVSKIVNICTDNRSLEKSFLFTKKFPSILYTAAALTPHDTHKTPEFFDTVEKYATEKNCPLIAIGETGLDYHYYLNTKETQKEFFIKHINLAQKCNLPLIIHCREAFTDLFDILKEEKFTNALLHCFTGTLVEAKKVLDNLKYISFSGIITFNKSKALQEVVKYCPLDKIVIETDSPYLAPQKFRGKDNEPAYLIEIAKKVAELKNVDLDQVIKITRKNSLAFYRKVKLKAP